MANNDKSKEALAAAKASREVRASKFQRVFLSAEGEEVLKILKAQFSPAELFNPNSDSATFVAIGERNVVTNIEQMMRYGNE